jgi:phosphoserine phosphatase
MSAQEFAPGLFVRGITPPLRLADYKLIAFDMDSTLVNTECVRRVAMLAGMPETALQRVYDERLRINLGVEVFVDACRRAGLKTLLVSKMLR